MGSLLDHGNMATNEDVQGFMCCPQVVRAKRASESDEAAIEEMKRAAEKGGILESSVAVAGLKVSAHCNRRHSRARPLLKAWDGGLGLPCSRTRAQVHKGETCCHHDLLTAAMASDEAAAASRNII